MFVDEEQEDKVAFGPTRTFVFILLFIALTFGATLTSLWTSDAYIFLYMYFPFHLVVPISLSQPLGFETLLLVG